MGRPGAGEVVLVRQFQTDVDRGRGYDGLALFVWLLDPGGGEGEGVDVVGLVAVGLLQAGACEGLGSVRDTVALEDLDDGRDDVEDVVGVGLGRGLGGGTYSVMVGHGEADGSLGETAAVGGLGVVDVVEVDEAAGPLHGGLGEVELSPVLVDVAECRYLVSDAVLDVEEYMLHRVNGFYGLNGLFVKGFRDFFCDFLFDGGGEFGAFADEPALRDADVVGTSGVGGALVVGGGVWEVAFDGDGAVAGYELDGASEVACGTGKDLALAGGPLGALEAALDLLPGAAKEALLLEILLEHADGEVAEFLRQVAFELTTDGLFDAFKVVAKVLDFHFYSYFCKKISL